MGERGVIVKSGRSLSAKLRHRPLDFLSDLRPSPPLLRLRLLSEIDEQNSDVDVLQMMKTIKQVPILGGQAPAAGGRAVNLAGSRHPPLA